MSIATKKMNIVESKQQLDVIVNTIFTELITLAGGDEKLEKLAWEFRCTAQEKLNSIMQEFIKK